MLRKVLFTVLGHVDHGKTSILDKIRQTTVTEGEAGLITQSIGASIIPAETIERVCGPLLKDKKAGIPGLLAIDTPGHAAFTSLRKRGGNLADIAIIVIDINEGFRPQTEEAIEIVKNAKTPFIIVANKIDLIPGWQQNSKIFLQNFASQNPQTQTKFEEQLYTVVGQVHEKFGFNADRFDRVDDYTKTIAVIPCSAHTGEGIPELLMVISGLAQKYFEQNLNINLSLPAKGTVLEVKEEKGLGKTLDVIIYDGSLKVNDEIVIGGINEPIITKVKALFEPNPLKDMREKKTKFKSVKEVFAATGVKISAKNVEEVIAGMPIHKLTSENKQEVLEKIKEEVEEVLVQTDDEGIIIKADSLGSLEAISKLFSEKGIKIRKAGIGPITKKDIIDAEANEDPLTKIILGFNVPETTAQNVKIIAKPVIYHLLEDFEKWVEETKSKLEAKQIDKLKRPFKIELLSGYVFRQNNPAIVGVSILGGTVKTNVDVMNKSGQVLSSIKQLQLEQKTVEKGEKGQEVAISLPGVTVGRQINEGDILISSIPEEDFKKFKEFKQYLSEDEKAILKEIAEIKRELNPVWGV